MIFKTFQRLTAADLIDIQRLTEPWETYNVQWTSGGVQPVLGTGGTLVGRKMVVGKTRWNFISLVFGPATTFGTGQYFLSTSDTARQGGVICGAMYILDAGTANRNAIAVLTSTRDSIFGVTSSDTDVSATVPQTFVNGDNISALIEYEVA